MLEDKGKIIRLNDTFSKLTQKQIQELWGQEGPYSQVEIKTQERLLDDHVSRVFLYVEANINPFTFKYIKKNRDKFADDIVIQHIIETAEYQGFKNGFYVVTYSGQYVDESIVQEAKEYLNKTRAAVIKMHKFVMDQFDLGY